VSHLLEMLGRGLGSDLGDLLDRYFWTPGSESIEQLRRRCSELPERPERHLQLGLAYLRAVQLDEAIRHLSDACRCRPDYLAARLALATAYDEQGDPARALEQLKIANQTHTGEVAVLFCIGFCLEKLTRSDEAAEYYRDAIGRDGTFGPARERLAAIAVLRDDLDEAIEQYRFLRDDEPEDAFFRAALAHLYYRAGRYPEAIEEFETAIAMGPENWALVDDEVEALVADGHLREAIERLHALIAQQGPFADLHVRLADLYSKVGNDEAALRNYHLALEAQPEYLEATVKLGTHHLIQGRWEEAGEAFHQAADLNDRVLACYVGMGVAQGGAGKDAEAMNSFDLAAAIEPNSTLLLAEMAKLQLKSAVAEQYAESFSAGGAPQADELDLANDDLLYRQTQHHAEQVGAHGDHADVRYRYAVLLRAQGRATEALHQLREAVRISPTYVQAIIKLGITQQELGMVEQAIRTFHRALDIEPHFVDLHYRLGLLYTSREQFEQAVRHMEAAAGAKDNDQIRAALALSLQNMGLMDRAAATWRSLWQMHRARAG